MKIAILSYEYPPDTGFGGIGTYSYYQARALAKLGHDVHVFAGSLEPGIHHSEHDGVRVTRVKAEGFHQGLLQPLRDKRCWWSNNRAETGYAAYRAFRKAFDKEQFDFVEYPECGADGMLISTLVDVPTVVKFHSPARLIMGLYEVSRMDREICSFFEQIAVNNATVKTSCSQFLADEVVAKMGVPQPVHVVPNGIDLDLFDQDEGIDVYERFGLPRDPDSTVVFFANRLEERKGVHLLADVCRHVLQKFPKVHFAFAGDDLFGFMKNKIRPALTEAGVVDRLHHFGKLHLPEVRAILKQRADVFLIPSLWENAPYSCIEAMSAGRAIVSSDCGGMPELVQDGTTGVLAANDDADAFIAGLERVLGDRGLCESMGRNARAEVERRLTDVKTAQLAVDTWTGELARRSNVEAR